MSNEVALAEAASGPDPAAGLRAARALRELADRLEALQVQNARDRAETMALIDVKPGQSVMEGAVKNNVPGIDADCGGACACATCHVYVREDFMPKVGTPSAMEQSMLDFAENVKENSRLSCQIKIRDDLDGLKVTTPESQH